MNSRGYHDHAQVDAPGWSPGDRAIERARRSQLRPGQFRLATLMTATALLAVVLGAVRLGGVSYSQFFTACSAGVFVFLPLLSWFFMALLGLRSRRQRYSIACGVAAVGLVALSVVIAVHPPSREKFVVVLAAAGVFWPLLAIWAHSLDIVVFGGTRNRDPNSMWSRFSLALARMREQGGALVFRCCRCQQIREDSSRYRREGGWLCQECYLFEMRHPDELEIPGDVVASPDSENAAGGRDDHP